MADIDTNTALMIAAIGAFSALIGGLISSGTNFLIEWQKDRKEKRKLFFDLKKKAYFRLIEDATEYLNYIHDHPERDDAPDSEPLVKLRKSYREALLVGDKGSTIRTAWKTLNWEFLENELIPALRDDLRCWDEPETKSLWQSWRKENNVSQTAQPPIQEEDKAKSWWLFWK